MLQAPVEELPGGFQLSRFRLESAAGVGDRSQTFGSLMASSRLDK